MHDGGSIYNLSADPGAVFEDNYMYDNNHTVECSRFLDTQAFRLPID